MLSRELVAVSSLGECGAELGIAAAFGVPVVGLCQHPQDVGASAFALSLSLSQPLAQGARPVAELPFLCLWMGCAFSGNSQLCFLAVHHSALLWPPALGPGGSCGQGGDTLALVFWGASSLL